MGGVGGHSPASLTVGERYRSSEPGTDWAAQEFISCLSDAKIALVTVSFKIRIYHASVTLCWFLLRVRSGVLDAHSSGGHRVDLTEAGPTKPKALSHTLTFESQHVKCL